MTTYKGIDDLIAAGHQPRRHRGEDARSWISELRARHRACPPRMVAPETTTLERDRDTVPAFPVEVLPDAIREYIEQIALSMDCPTDFPGVAAIIIAGAAIGSACGVEVKPGWIELPRAYAAIVGQPGKAKTPPLMEVMRPIHEEQSRLKRDFDTASREYELQLREYKRQLNSGDTSGSPLVEPQEPPPMQHTFVSDTTIEALAVSLQSSPKGLLVCRDELSAWVGSMDQYRRGADRQFYLSAWSGEMVKVDRKSQQGRSIIIANPCLSVLGGIQPDLLDQLQADRGRDDGFLDRILFSFPPRQPASEWTDAAIADEMRLRWKTVLDRLLALAPSPNLNGSTTPQILQLTGEARQAYIGCFNTLTRDINGANGSMQLEGAYAKLKSYCARFALVIQLLHWAATDPFCEALPTFVEAESVHSATQLCQYFKAHAALVRQRMGQTEEDKKVSRLLEWMRRHDRTQCEPRELLRSNVANVRCMNDVRALLYEAQQRGLGTVRAPETGRGRGVFELTSTADSEQDRATAG